MVRMKSFVVGVAAWSLLAGSAAHAAAVAQPAVQPVNPLVAVSAYGTTESRAIVAAANSGAVVAAAQGYSNDAPRVGPTGRDLALLVVAIGGLFAAWLLLDGVVLGNGHDLSLNIPQSPD